jgi:hypothetical protein
MNKKNVSKSEKNDLGNDLLICELMFDHLAAIIYQGRYGQRMAKPVRQYRYKRKHASKHIQKC